MKRLMIAVTLLTLGGVARAEHEGCMVQGNGAFFVAQCKYVAQSDTQDVIAATINHWDVWVVRHNCPVWQPGCQPVLADGCLPAVENQCQPYRNNSGAIVTTSRKVTLARGEGPPVGAPPQVHPRVGEEVTVELYPKWAYDLDDVEGSLNGSFGVLWVGATSGHP